MLTKFTYPWGFQPWLSCWLSVTASALPPHLKKKLPCRLYLAFHWKDFREKSYLLLLKACASNGPLFVTIEHCTWKTKHFREYPGFHCRDFPKIHTSRPSLISCKRCKFCCDRPLTKGIVLAEHRTFSVVSQVPLKGFLLKFVTIIFHYKRCQFGCDWPVIKGTLFEEQCDFVHTSPSIGGIFMKLHTPHFTRMRYKRCKIKRHRSIIKGVY